MNESANSDDSDGDSVFQTLETSSSSIRTLSAANSVIVEDLLLHPCINALIKSGKLTVEAVEDSVIRSDDSISYNKIEFAFLLLVFSQIKQKSS